MSSSGKVAIVTGASRGIGKGIALALAKEGATVFITGRAKSSSGAGVEAAAKEVNSVAKHGGSCAALICDHADDAAAENVVDIVFKQCGRLDVLVNNAFCGAEDMGEMGKVKFWDRPLSYWDMYHNVGFRSHYAMTALCAREWDKRKQSALVVNVSSAAGLSYAHDVPYSVAKGGLDRLTSDSAVELKSIGVAVVSMWPGAVATELVKKTIEEAPDSNFSQSGVFKVLESVEFAGRGVVALAGDKDILKVSGKVFLTPELAQRYGFTDVDGQLPWSPFLKMARKGMSQPPPMWVPPAKL